MMAVVCAIPFAFFFFILTVPMAADNVKELLWIIIILIVVTRIPNAFVQNRFLAPIVEYLNRKERGEVISRSDLEKYYLSIGKIIINAQTWATVLWLISIFTFSAITNILYFKTLFSFIAVTFTGLIAMTLSLSFSYFLYKKAIRPIIVPIMKDLPENPKDGATKIDLRIKMGLSILGISALSLLVFSLLITSRVKIITRDVILDFADETINQISQNLKRLPESERADYLSSQQSTVNLSYALIKPEDGALIPIKGHEPLPDSARTKILFRAEDLKSGISITVETPEGYYIAKRVDGSYLVLGVTNKLLTNMDYNIFWITITFMVIIMVVLGLYILFLSLDIARSMKLMVNANKQLADGDITEIPNVWSDDETGLLADSLKVSFQNLRGLLGKINEAANNVQRNSSRSLSEVENMRTGVINGIKKINEAGSESKGLEERASLIGKSIDQVASATQETSSTILEMQASIEEIATNAESLQGSIEKTAASSSEMSVSAEQVNKNSESLHSLAQESLSFLTELDSAMDETHRNSEILQSLSERVTQDAKEGYDLMDELGEQIQVNSGLAVTATSISTDLATQIDKIGKILDVIQDITEQTNLLALNASIIAASAGDYGKSFSVVAGQIRELSAKTGASAKDIRDLILKIQGGTKSLVSSMDETKKGVDSSILISEKTSTALRTILESASSQEEMSIKIRNATEELAHGGQSVAKSMQNIFEMIEGITKATEEQAYNSQTVAKESEKLKDVSIQLKNATEEQAKGSRVISEAMSHISSDAESIAKSVQDQIVFTKHISVAMESVVNLSKGLEKSVDEIYQMANSLEESANDLILEIKKFKIE